MQPESSRGPADLVQLLRHSRSLWTGLGKSGYAARLLAATAATSGLAASHVHAEDLLHGELSTLQRGDLLVAISWSAQSGQIAELIARAPSATALITGMTGAGSGPVPDYVIYCSPVPDALLDGIPSESVLETLRVGYDLIAAATTPAQRRRSLRAGHPHGALARVAAAGLDEQPDLPGQTGLCAATRRPRPASGH